MKIIHFLLAIITGIILSGCDDNKEFLYQDISSRIWLGRTEQVGNITRTLDSLESSFLYLPFDQELDTLYITANVMGQAAPVDRPFLLEVIPGETNVPSSAYHIGEAIVPANSFVGLVPVVVHKNVEGLDLTKEKANLSVRFIPNAHFLNGTPGTDHFKLTWYNFLTQPPQWNSLITYLGVFSQARYKFILDFYGEIDFGRFVGNINLSLGLQSALRQTLLDYNNDPANEGRPEGWPYLNDDGTPLTF